MSKQILFFATKSDLLPKLAKIIMWEKKPMKCFLMVIGSLQLVLILQ